jgi:hypothetical protein
VRSHALFSFEHKTKSQPKPALKTGSHVWPVPNETDALFKASYKGCMQRGFHIFRQLSDGTPLWIEAAFSLEQAVKRLGEFAAAEPAVYAIFDVSSRCFVVPFSRSRSAIGQRSSASPANASRHCTLGRYA